MKDYLKKPHVTFENVIEYKKFEERLSEEDVRSIEADVKYEGYLKRQDQEVAQLKKMDKVKIPEKLKFKDVIGLSPEAVEKLQKFRPKTLGEADRISGITPAAVVNIYAHLNSLKKRERRSNVPRET